MHKQWYFRHLNQIRIRAGARYTPELNVTLPISEIFDGIGRTEKFYATIREKYGELLREFRNISSEFEDDTLQKDYGQIKQNAQSLYKLIETIKNYNTDCIPWDEIKNQTKILSDILWEFANTLGKAKEQAKGIKISPKENGSYHASPSEKINSDIHHIYKTQEILRYFERLSSSAKAHLANHPFLLLTGSAGTGKTHLLCDVVEQRVKNGARILPAILIFGECFSRGKDVWSQILKQIDATHSFSTKGKFLQKLDAMGKRMKCRSLLVVDALNETHVSGFWKSNLSGFVKEIKKYSNIALIISVRNGFEREVMSEKQKNFFIREEHYGFRFREWEAVSKFFEAFKLPLPEIPLLMPEFQNPLFLLLFCKAFQKRKNKSNKQIFRGHEGATYIFETYIDKVSKSIEKKFKIESGAGKNIWDTIIEKIAEEMVLQNNDRITEYKLNEIIKNAHSRVNSGNFIQSLERNMLVVRVPRYEKGERASGFDIRFPFQKFSDHLIGRFIFKNYENEFGKSNKNLETAKKFFSKRRKLGRLLSKTWSRGIIEALSIQCPEQLRGIEFIEAAPYLRSEQYLFQIAVESFVESLIWRNPKAFSTDCENTLAIINKDVIISKQGHEQLLNAFLSVAPIPNHPFNAECLHRHLFKISMPERDSWWSTFLHYQYGNHGGVDRLLQWAWSDQNKLHLNDESVFLTSIALSWFLTTPNRFVRDKATKGLVCLLQDRIQLLPLLLEKFKGINDPYIAERLFAVAYGCVLRNQSDTKNLKILAEWIYKNVFKNNKPPTHILLRDYARGVIEESLKIRIQSDINENNINPPYKTNWPKNIPTEEELKRKYYPEDFFKEKTKERGFLDIWYSVLGGGDFDRYIIGTNFWSCGWSGRSLKSPEPNRDKLLKIFETNLTAKQKKLLRKVTSPFSKMDWAKVIRYKKFVGSGTETELSDDEIKKQELENEKKRQGACTEFELALPKVKKLYFRKEIKPFLDSRGHLNDPLDNFDLKIAQRWIFNRVVDIGYNPKLHGEFDSVVNRYGDNGRSEHKAERIGKKYQWIAYHEFMALVSDHFEFKGATWNSVKQYKGPWHPRIRDIDPSFIMQNDNCLKQSTVFSRWESNRGHYDAWDKKKSDVDWIKTKNDLPKPSDIILIKDDNKKEWLMLEGFIRWEEKKPPEFRKYEVPAREVWYMVKSYIVKQKDAKKFSNWAMKQNFWGRWMPESNSFYEIFLGEYPNSIAFDYIKGDYNIWTKSKRGSGDLAVPVVVTDDAYLNEFTLDCSHSESVTVKLPCKWLVNKMGLHNKYFDGRFYDEKGCFITLATSIFEECFPSALLIDRQHLIDFLDKNKYSLFWTLLGEKQVITESFSEKKHAGRLEISGIYTLNNRNQIIGKSKNNPRE